MNELNICGLHEGREASMELNETVSAIYILKHNEYRIKTQTGGHCIVSSPQLCISFTTRLCKNHLSI